VLNDVIGWKMVIFIIKIDVFSLSYQFLQFIFYFLCFFIMPLKYVRKYSENPRPSWTKEILRQAIARINAGEIGIRKGY
jgi:hypothetical protein